MPDTYFESCGRSIVVDLVYPVSANNPVLIDGWVGIPASDGASGDSIAINIDSDVYQWVAPGGLSVSAGDTVYVTIASVSGAHEIPDNAYTTTADGANTVAIFKAVRDKDANNMVEAVLLSKAV